jgi:hypothetical protein
VAIEEMKNRRKQKIKPTATASINSLEALEENSQSVNNFKSIISLFLSYNDGIRRKKIWKEECRRVPRDGTQ